MENIIGKEVRHILSGLTGIVTKQIDFDFTLYEVDCGRSIAIWRYDHMEVIEGGEKNESEESGEARQSSNERTDR